MEVEQLTQSDLDNNEIPAFLVLEDTQAEFTKTYNLLGSVVSKLAGLSHRTYNRMQLIWVQDNHPKARNPQLPSAFTAPLTYKAEEYKLAVLRLDQGKWKLESKPAAAGTIEVVPWEDIAAGRLLPWAVVLDRFTGSDGSDEERTFSCSETLRLLKACSYPSDLVWVLSNKPLPNDNYGYFFPKPWTDLSPGTSSAQYDRTVEFMASTIKPYRDDLGKYMKTDAREFYEALLRRLWRDSLGFTPEARDALNDKGWLHNWTNAEDPAGRYAVHVAPAPTSETFGGAIRFTFFTQPLQGVALWEYFDGKTWGLPFRYLSASPDASLVVALRDFCDEGTNHALRRNLFVFLLFMLGGRIKMFDKLNAALPGYYVSTTNMYNKIEGIPGIPYVKGNKRWLKPWLGRFRVTAKQPDAPTGRLS